MHYTQANRAYWLTAIGLILLFFGCLVYLFLYTHKFNIGWIKYPVSLPLFQQVIYSLPSFLHVIVFTLLTLATYSHLNPSLIIRWCLFWGIINGLCEYIQRYDALPYKTILPDFVVRYFESGTFDHLDLIAIGLGVTLVLLFIPVLRNDS